MNLRILFCLIFMLTRMQYAEAQSDSVRFSTDKGLESTNPAHSPGDLHNKPNSGLNRPCKDASDTNCIKQNPNSTNGDSQYHPVAKANVTGSITEPRNAKDKTAGQKPYKFVGFHLSKTNDKTFKEIEGATDQHGKFTIMSNLDAGEYLLKVKTKACECSRTFMHKAGDTTTITLNCCEVKKD